MSFLEEPGELAEVPLAAVLLEVMNQRGTGVLTVAHDGGSSRVFFQGGVPVGAQSFTGFRPLGQILLAAGLIDVEQLGTSLAEMSRTKRPQGAVLIELGAVTREQVDRALSEQQAAYLTEIAALASGRFHFDPQAPVPEWTNGIRISPFRAIVDALETPQATPLVGSALQMAAVGSLALAPGGGQLGLAFGFNPAEAALVARLEGLTTLDAFLSEPGVGPERARAIASALLLLGLAAPRPVSQSHIEAMPSLVVDLADLAGVPVEEVRAPARVATPASARETVVQGPPRGATTGEAQPTGERKAPLRRSDPEEARRRRQRLLQRAMQNMGVGPLSGQPPPPSARPPAASSTAPPGRPRPTAAEEELRRSLEAAIPQSKALDLFERLGLSRTANREEVKAAYFQLAKKLHPDRFGAPSLADVAPIVKDLFAAVNEAYEVLSDDRRRIEYLAKSRPRTKSEGGANPGSAAIDIQKADACLRTRDFARARSFYEAALRVDPRPEYQVAFAHALMVDPGGDRSRAKALAEAALEDPASTDRAAFVLGLVARDEGDDVKAERMLRRALQANPKHLEAERELRALEARRGKSRPPGQSGLFKKR
jgi:tetratricopeptide (TPR) repeat protein